MIEVPDRNAGGVFLTKSSVARRRHLPRRYGVSAPRIGSALEGRCLEERRARRRKHRDGDIPPRVQAWWFDEASAPKSRAIR